MQGNRKTKVGRVVSDKMDKTIVVSVERLTRHPLYKRVIRASSKFAAHDELNSARVGDTVRIEESRPLSRTKRWQLVEVHSRAGEDQPSGRLMDDFALLAVAERCMFLEIIQRDPDSFFVRRQDALIASDKRHDRY